MELLLNAKLPDQTFSAIVGSLIAGMSKTDKPDDAEIRLKKGRITALLHGI